MSFIQDSLQKSWTVRKKGRKKNDAFKLWTWRRILRVPWTENRTNLSVFEEVKPKRSLEATILRLKSRYFGHVMRAKRSLEQDIMLGQVEGHRKRSLERDIMLGQVEGHRKRSLERDIMLGQVEGHRKRSLERDIMLGHVEGHRKQGKPRMRWLDSIKEVTGLRLEDLREAVQDRK